MTISRLINYWQDLKMAESEKKKLHDLRVVDLKSELEKRSLETSGVKTVLIERLEKVIKKLDALLNIYNEILTIVTF